MPLFKMGLRLKMRSTNLPGSLTNITLGALFKFVEHYRHVAV